MSDQTVLIDQFLSSVISTIHPDEIFDSIIDTAVRLLSPDGLLLTIRDDVSPSYTSHAVLAISPGKKILFSIQAFFWNSF